MASEFDLRQRGIWLLKPCTRKLIGFLANTDSRLRGEGAKALGKIGDHETVAPLVEALLKEKQDEQMPLALAEIGDSAALAPLLSAFKEADREVRPNIALALGAFKDPAVVTTLIEALSDLDPNVRYNSITSLGRLKDSSAVSSLLGCLGESNEWIFLNVVDALAKLGAHRATNPLVAFYLKERNERKRSAIITALGFIADLTSVPTLTKALRDTDDRVKANAIESLGRMNLPPEKAMNLVQPFLKHPNNRVRGNALVFAGELGKIDLTPYLKIMQDDPEKWIRATLGYVLSIIDYPEALQVIIDLLKDDDPDVRKNAALALSSRAKEAQTELLVKMLADPIPFVRLQAVITLGRLKIVSAVPWLVKMLKTDRNFKIRSAVITSLGHIGDKNGIPTLQSALRDRDSRVRANAVEAIEEVLGEACIGVLRPLLNDPDNRTRSNVTKALFRQGDLEVINDLEKMLMAKEISTRISAAYAVGQIGLALREIEISPLPDPLKSSLEKVEPPPEFKQKPVEPEPVAEPVKLPDSREELRKVFLDLFKQGNLKKSLEVALEYLNKNPHDLMANFFVGNLHFQLSHFEESIGFFQKTIEQDPFHIQAHSNLGIACFRSGKLHEAIDYFKKALKLKPDLTVIRFNLANLYLKTNRWEEAARQFEEGCRYQEPNARILANMAFSYQKLGKFDRAVSCYSKAVAIDPADPGNYYNWAIILARTGKKSEALEVIHRALKDVPVTSPGLKNLRDLLERIKG